MTEQDWLTSENPAAMLRHVAPTLAAREAGKIQAVLNSAVCGDERYCLGLISSGPHHELIATAINITTRYRPVACAAIRDIVGNPFKTVSSLSLEFALAYARMNQQQRDAAINPLTKKPLVVVGELEWECLRVLADEVERLRAKGT